MPELPEVETTVRAINKFENKRLLRVIIHNRNLRWKVDKIIEKKIDNKKIFCDGSKELKNPFTTSIAIPADFSSAAFFIILALVTENTVMTLKNIGLNPTRARLLTVLKDMGASIEITSQKGIEPYGDIKVSSSKLTNIAIAADDIPFIIDEIPILAVAAMFATGKMIVTNAEELRVKESDRIKSTVELVEQFGAIIHKIWPDLTESPSLTKGGESGFGES